MFCDYEVVPISTGGFRHTCRMCGDVRVKPSARYRRRCPKTPAADDEVLGQGIPPLGRRIANFSKAAIGHALRGAPNCSDEEIARRHAICQACELYRPDRDRPDVGTCTHETCGCGIYREVWYLSKLAWADQSCPLGKWIAAGAKNAKH
jgi:hypothetical protein